MITSAISLRKLLNESKFVFLLFLNMYSVWENLFETNLQNIVTNRFRFIMIIVHPNHTYYKNYKLNA